MMQENLSQLRHDSMIAKQMNVIYIFKNIFVVMGLILLYG